MQILHSVGVPSNWYMGSRELKGIAIDVRAVICSSSEVRL